MKERLSMLFHGKSVRKHMRFKMGLGPREMFSFWRWGRMGSEGEIPWNLPTCIHSQTVGVLQAEGFSRGTKGLSPLCCWCPFSLPNRLPRPHPPPSTRGTFFLPLQAAPALCFRSLHSQLSRSPREQPLGLQ